MWAEAHSPGQLLQPVRQHPGSGRTQAGADFLALRTQGRDVDAGGGQLAGVADQPLLDAAAIRLGVELERQDVAAQGEGLVLVNFAAGQKLRALRQVEGVAVPVQHRLRSKRGDAGARSSVGEADAAPANFLLATGIDASAKRRRDKLRTETDAQGGAPRYQAIFQRQEF